MKVEGGEEATDGSECKGEVKWFDAKKGYGFLTTSQRPGEDIFVHQRDLDPNTRALTTGDVVDFVYVVEEGKAKAKDVSNPTAAAAPASEHASLTNPAFAARLNNHPDIKLGRVKWWDMKKGFGFLTPTDNTADVFVHQSEVVSNSFRALSEGAHVEYKLRVEVQENGREQTKATEVTAPGGGPIEPPAPTQNGHHMQGGGVRGAGGLLSAEGRMYSHQPQHMQQFSPVAGGNGQRKVGTVKFYDSKKGYGFILTAENTDIFFHSSSIPSVPIGSHVSLMQGEVLEYSFEVRSGKPRATNLTRPGGEAIGAMSMSPMSKHGHKGQWTNNRLGVYGGVDQQQAALMQQQMLQQQHIMQPPGYYGSMSPPPPGQGGEAAQRGSQAGPGHGGAVNAQSNYGYHAPSYQQYHW